MDEINEHCSKTSQSNKTLKVLHLVYVRHNKVFSFLLVLHVHSNCTARYCSALFSDIDISFLVNTPSLKAINTNNCLVTLPTFSLMEDSKETPNSVIFSS